jgi:hypothetical protein
MFIGMILTLAINDQARMLIGQAINLMTLYKITFDPVRVV